MVGFGLDYACAHIIILAEISSENLLPIRADFVTERDILSSTIDKGREGLETEILSALRVTSLWRIGAMQAGAHATVALCTCSLHKKCPRDFRFGEKR